MTSYRATPNDSGGWDVMEHVGTFATRQGAEAAVAAQEIKDDDLAAEIHDALAALDKAGESGSGDAEIQAGRDCADLLKSVLNDRF